MNNFKNNFLILIKSFVRMKIRDMLTIAGFLSSIETSPAHCWDFTTQSNTIHDSCGDSYALNSSREH